MTRLAPVSRRELIQRLRELGFEGPFSGGRHQFMVREGLRLVLPNPHRGAISVDLLRRILRHASIDPQEWMKL